MANGVLITQRKPKYSENILPTYAAFDDEVTINQTSGTGSSAAVYQSSVVFDGAKAIQLYNDNNVTPLVVNFGTALEKTISVTGNYILSFEMRHNMPAVQYFPDTLKISISVNGIFTMTMICNDNYDPVIMSPNYWYTWGQTFVLNAGDVVNYKFELTTNPTKPLGEATMWIDALKLELDDRNLGIPSIYSPPIALNPNLYLTESSYQVALVKVGSETFTLDGVEDTFVIPHGLPTTPTSFALTFSDGANTEFLESVRTINATNITITANTPPLAGSITVYWQVFK